MPVTRLRMRPWLEEQINSNKIPGLSWINKDKMIFQIPWKHAARHGWDINKDACLFRSWAVHTGRFKSGEKETDPKTWKANFRCAMNSLPDIKEVKDKSIYKGSSAVRVYQMFTPQIKAEKKERRSKAKCSKSKAKYKTEEDEESVKTSPLPVDHSYTANVYTDQEDMDSVDAAVMSLNESVSSTLDWDSQLEMPLPDSTNNLYPFQVSPLSSSSEEEEDFPDDFLRMMLEPSTEWQQTSIDGKGFFTNESGMQNACLTEISSAFDGTLSGEIKVRFSTDLINWPDYSSRATGLAVPTF
ncbi:interferon regulatory factor 1 L homeolog [Xenopus laevis]|uniref:Interferon regulatory factor n=2 Tax=Xenopus laevis TaxID=8355 RepID=Q6PB00_XENLA|nr:interferon regulatory factor 1 L homeolog [Xenopus laevis]AAH59984.1 MGC68691 protein [Xenopus laevis]OCT88527.1 hypothetical protein XELAEV_18017156mg [Xenopus laevis]